MNSQLIFFLNLAIGAFFVVWYLTARNSAGSQPTRLNLKRGNEPPPPPPPQVPSKYSVVSLEDPVVLENKRRAAAAKTLNVLFMYNGHDWDAYEVLGVPAGAALPAVTAHYQNLIKTADGGQREFLEAAYQAILKKF